MQLKQCNHYLKWCCYDVLFHDVLFYDVLFYDVVL